VARARTTKTLAKRIELDYFHKPNALRAWMRRLSWTAAGIAGLVVLLALRPAGRIAWSSGGLTPPHALFEADCAACHARAAGGPVEDAACTACHAGPPHHAGAPQAPACASCHEEHRGRPLVRVDDSHCTACHSGLKAVPRAAPKGAIPEPAASTTGSAVRAVAERVVSFPNGHPEFHAVALGRDEGRIRLNHELHLRPDLKGPRGPVTLDCAACHAADAEGRLMRPVDYETHCASCHPLTFESGESLPAGTVVPHGDPAEALRRLVELYAGTAVAEDDSARAVDPVARALARQRARRARLESPAYVPLSRPAGTERAFVVERVGLAVRILERQTCALCHGPGSGEPLPAAAPPPDGGSILPAPPAVPRPEVPLSWMPRARFAHRPHRTLACASCHPAVAASQRTSDVLVPGRDVCASCHHAGGGAPVTCVFCHGYHVAEENRLGPGRLGLPRDGLWIRGAPAPAPPAPR
jgi:hypothetical protein